MVSATKRLRLLEEKEQLEADLIEFHKAAWEHMDPAPYVHGRHMDAIAEHLEAIAYGHIRKLLVNIAPRHCKSLLVSVSFPAWIWAKEADPEFPLIGPQAKFLCLSYGDTLSLDLALAQRRLVQSDWYQARWGDRVKICADQEAKSKFDTAAGGTRISASFKGGVTGRGGDIKIIDDPLKAGDEKSEPIRQGVLDLYDGTLKSRITDPRICAEIIIMQRLHQRDLSGHILSTDDDFVHLYLPEEFEEGRRCCTSVISKGSGRYAGEPWQDWREEEGQLLWPERFSEKELRPYKRDKYEWAGQWQQRPEAKGGGIILREYWQPWIPKNGNWPQCDYILASLDPAYTDKDKNDPSALTIWGTFDHEGERAAILLYAWRKWLVLHGPEAERWPGETNKEYRLRTMPEWGLVEHVKDALERFKVDRLLIENKASGIDVNTEMMRLYKDSCIYELIDPKSLGKIARVWRVQPIFSEGQVWAPWTPPSYPYEGADKDEDWYDWALKNGSWRKFADLVIDEISMVTPLRTGQYMDLTDTTTQGLRWLRDHGFLTRRSEKAADQQRAAERYKEEAPLYPA